jgi:hypothetical protein
LWSPHLSVKYPEHVEVFAGGVGCSTFLLVSVMVA